jgi:hypothetical protein
MRIIVTEYPKSGGSWLTSMLGDALGLAKRDIYVTDGYSAFNVALHPWYISSQSLELTDSCVIKSHEYPDSPLIRFPAKYVHLVRDGRDVVISKYFYEKDFCVNNGIYERFEVPFVKYLEKVATEWSDYVKTWLGVIPGFYRYEDFLENPYDSLRRLVHEIDIVIDDDKIMMAIETNTKDKFKASLDKVFTHNTFVRKATSGYWVNYIRGNEKDIFKHIANDALMLLGYEKDLKW